MQVRNAANVFPDPVGAEMSVVFPARMCGQPCCWGSVGEPSRVRNHSRTTGCAQSSADEETIWSETLFVEETDGLYQLFGLPILEIRKFKK
jgi:hypothetical protein